MNSLNDIEAMLREGMKLSGQTSMGRRPPASISLPQLTKARALLRSHVAQNPADPRGWKLLSLAEECFLAYDKAIVAFERALALTGSRGKRDLKRLGALRTHMGEWSALGLTPRQLADLGAFLEEKLSDMDFHDLRWTEQWLRDHLPTESVRATLDAIVAHSGYCDADVLDTVVRGDVI